MITNLCGNLTRSMYKNCIELMERSIEWQFSGLKWTVELYPDAHWATIERMMRDALGNADRIRVVDLSDGDSHAGEFLVECFRDAGVMEFILVEFSQGNINYLERDSVGERLEIPYTRPIARLFRDSYNVTRPLGGFVEKLTDALDNTETVLGDVEALREAIGKFQKS